MNNFLKQKNPKKPKTPQKDPKKTKKPPKKKKKKKKKMSIYFRRDRSYHLVSCHDDT